MSTNPDYSRFQLVPPPPTGFWRVTDWDNPLEPRPAPPPLDVNAEPDTDSGRWDAPDASYRTLYCCTEPDGALGEKIAAFAPRPAAVVRIEAFLASEPDPEFGSEHLARPLDAEDIGSFDWTLVHVEAEDSSEFIDVWHWRTCVAVAPSMAATLASYGLKMLDRRALADERRGFTRRLAGLLRSAADAARTAGRGLHGLRYESRLAPAWECWALWEPLPVRLETADAVQVDYDNPHLRTAAAKLGVPLAD